MKRKKEVEIYTDGACTGNPGPGGWAAVLLYGEHHKEISGGAPATTNQKMELQAAIEALKVLNQPCRVRLYSDSAYLINCFSQKWYEGWQRRGWKNASGEPVKNREQWEELLRLCQIHDVEWLKVKGHAGNVWNERCDELARKEAAKQKK